MWAEEGGSLTAPRLPATRWTHGLFLLDSRPLLKDLASPCFTKPPLLKEEREQFWSNQEQAAKVVDPTLDFARSPFSLICYDS